MALKQFKARIPKPHSERVESKLIRLVPAHPTTADWLVEVEIPSQYRGTPDFHLLFVGDRPTALSVYLAGVQYMKDNEDLHTKKAIWDGDHVAFETPQGLA